MHYLLKQVHPDWYMNQLRSLKWILPLYLTWFLLKILFYQCFLFSLIIDLITAVIAQIFISTAELAIPVKIPTIETKAKMETHPATEEAKISKGLI